MVTTLFQRLGIFTVSYRDIRHYACKIAGTNRHTIMKYSQKPTKSTKIFFTNRSDRHEDMASTRLYLAIHSHHKRLEDSSLSNS